MNSNVHFAADMKFGWSFNDISARYAQGSMHRLCMDVPENTLEVLAKHYPDKILRALHQFEEGKIIWSTMLLRLADDVYVIARGNGLDDIQVIASDASTLQQHFNELHDVIKKVKGPSKPTFHMLSYDGSYLETVKADNLPDIMKPKELGMVYGSDIEKWINDLKKQTISRAGGFTLLDGPPGTGKTTLIMQMIQRLQDTHVFYVLPVSQASAFAAPEFVPFWQRQSSMHADKVKVIVMEDADGLIQRDRRKSEDVMLSAMLNIADGLPGRLLRLHVMCTINCQLSTVEPAMLRPGRLIKHRRIDLLEEEQAARIAKHRKLPWPPSIQKERYSLAEVLNPACTIPHDEPRKAIGFHR